MGVKLVTHTTDAFVYLYVPSDLLLKNQKTSTASSLFNETATEHNAGSSPIGVTHRLHMHKGFTGNYACNCCKCFSCSQWSINGHYLNILSITTSNNRCRQTNQDQNLNDYSFNYWTQEVHSQYVCWRFQVSISHFCKLYTEPGLACKLDAMSQKKSHICLKLRFKVSKEKLFLSLQQMHVKTASWCRNSEATTGKTYFWAEVTSKLSNG